MSDSLLDEIKAAQELATVIGMYDIVRNIACAGNVPEVFLSQSQPQRHQFSEFLQAQWEGCSVQFAAPPQQCEWREKYEQPSQSEWQQLQIIRQMRELRGSHVVSSNGTVLFHAVCDYTQQNWPITVTTFRTGAWVERIKEYSEKVSKEAREEEFEPFSQIDF